MIRNYLSIATLLTSALCAGAVSAQSVGGTSLDAGSLDLQAAELLRGQGDVRPNSALPSNLLGPQQRQLPPVRRQTTHANLNPPVTVDADGNPLILPFGSNLFSGGFSNDREDGLNPSYIIQPGDRVSVRIWGAASFSQSLTVDPQGNIFLPRVGPILVGGVRNSDLNTRVEQTVATVYTDNVKIYTSLDGSQPVAVFVTGYVSNPGRFAGIPSNSVLYFLDRAGGIDAERGSYRNIMIRRGDELIAMIDLYEFLTVGNLPEVQFKDGDTIVVSTRGPAISISGDVANSAIFELTSESISGAEARDGALPLPGVSHAAVSGVRNDQPYSIYVTIDEFDTLSLQAGDQVHFQIDQHDTVIVVEVEGSHLGPSRFAVSRDTHLLELLDYIEVDPRLADVRSVSLKRKAIAQRQAAALTESLRRLEARYLTASSQTDRESSIRAQEADLIMQFVKTARDVEPSGRLVVARGGAVADVLLQSGDIITIPARSDSVLISGEVLVTQALLYLKGHRARDYIKQSGGFNDQADAERIIVVRANGEVTNGINPIVNPGDEIIVLPKVPVKNLQLAATIVDIVYKIAVAASVAINL